ncbi:MAG: tetratricopeptide repeat protein [Pseudohongiella sp.]
MTCTRLMTRLPAAGLLLTLLLIVALPVQAQITIVDEDTELPDYTSYEVGLDALQAGDFDTALREFTQSAEEGLHLAQYNLGVMYYTGQGVPQSYETAYHWLSQSAEQGHLNSMFNLATLYYNGQGVNSSLMSMWPLSLISRRQNLQQAAAWYLEAAEYEHAGAQYNLATMYEAGEGVEEDLVKAYRWARLARDNEASGAEALVNRVQAAMSPAQLDQAQREYAEWVLQYRS